MGRCVSRDVIAQDLIWQTNNPAQDLWTPSRAFHLVVRENKSRRGGHDPPPDPEDNGGKINQQGHAQTNTKEPSRDQSVNLNV